MAEETFAVRDASHEYNGYIQALESLRVPLQKQPREFYEGLLETPLPNRLVAVREAGDLLPELDQRTFRRLLLLAQAKLGGQ